MVIIDPIHMDILRNIFPEIDEKKSKFSRYLLMECPIKIFPILNLKPLRLSLKYYVSCVTDLGFPLGML